MKLIGIAIFAGLALAVLVFQWLTFRKLSRIDREVWDLNRQLMWAGSNVFKQIEALGILNAILKPAQPLPQTRGFAASPDFLLAIAKHALKSRPDTMVECSSGTSTIVLALCAKINGKGHVYSLEHEPKYAEATREGLRQQGLSAFATVLDAPLKPVAIESADFEWYQLPQVLPEKIDLLVIDGPPASEKAQARYPAGPLLFPQIREGGAIFLDDADRDGEKQIVERWLSTFPSLQLERLDCEKGCVRLLC